MTHIMENGSFSMSQPLQDLKEMANRKKIFIVVILMNALIKIFISHDMVMTHG